MNDTDEIKVLLRQILEVQQAHLTAYQRASEQSLAQAARAISQQSKAIVMSKIALAFLFGAVGVGVLTLIANLGP